MIEVLEIAVIGHAFVGTTGRLIFIHADRRLSHFIQLLVLFSFHIKLFYLIILLSQCLIFCLVDTIKVITI